MNNGCMNGKVALVTGGGRGLGREVALFLAAEGAAVMVSDIFVDESGVAAAESVAQEIRQAGGKAASSTESVTDFEAADRMVAAAVEEFGQLDAVVSSAGNFSAKTILEIGEDEWDLVTDVHVTGHLATMRAAARQMSAQGTGGSIVTVASRGALFGKEVAYAGAKAAILGLTTSAALELAADGIRVNSVLPSAQTQLFKSGPERRLFGGMPASIDLDPSRLAPVVAFLAGDSAKDITGEFLYVSGGDIATYRRPFQRSGLTFTRSLEPWTVESVAQYLPAVLRAGRGEF